MDEAQLIDRYFRTLGSQRADVRLGIGDDAALLAVPGDAELVLTTDALVEGTHFLPDAPARSLGHRALAVNLSDIAAMGAAPSWMLLSLLLPRVDEAWLTQFCAGLGALAERHGVALVGGNLSRGPLSITIELAGWVPRGQALQRDGARAGDALYVSGTPGDAAAGRRLLGRDERLEAEDSEARELVARFEYPTARVALGQGLRGLASACIDVSDGLYIDARRMLTASRCGGEIDAQRLPLSRALRDVSARQGWPAHQAAHLALSGGEDYELCFSVPPARQPALQALAERLGEAVTCIGAVTAGGAGLSVTSSNPQLTTPEGFDHFRG